MYENIGIDGVHCTIVLKKQELNDYHIDKNLKNSDGTIYGNVKSYGENIKLRFNIPLMIRENNLIPFTMDDMDEIPYIKTKLLTDLNNIFGTKIKSIKPNAIEVNCTKLIEDAKVSNMLKLIKYAYLDKMKQTATWELEGRKIYDIRSVGMLTYLLMNEYRLKCYDKSEQLNSRLELNDMDNLTNDLLENLSKKNSGKISGNLSGKLSGKTKVANQWQNSGKSEKVVKQKKSGKLEKWKEFWDEENERFVDNIIRIEMIMQGRRIKQTYGKDCQLFDILDELPKMIDLFVEKYENDVLKKINKYLARVKTKMFEEMSEGNKPKDVVEKFSPILVDRKQIQMAMKRYYQFKGYQDQSKAISKVLAKSYKLEEKCIYELTNLLD